MLSFVSPATNAIAVSKTMYRPSAESSNGGESFAKKQPAHAPQSIDARSRRRAGGARNELLQTVHRAAQLASETQPEVRRRGPALLPGALLRGWPDLRRQ